jgi:hypothetical protein
VYQACEDAGLGEALAEWYGGSYEDVWQVHVHRYSPIKGGRFGSQIFEWENCGRLCPTWGRTMAFLNSTGLLQRFWNNEVLFKNDHRVPSMKFKYN